MAGHSHWAGIKHKKGKADKQRSKIFSKLSKEITVAAKLGDKDPSMNPRLRSAMQAARSANMPKDNIERAIDKSSAGAGVNFENLRYEGFGPDKIAVIVETLTDNKNRTASNIRTIFQKNGGNLGTQGSASHNFNQLGVIKIDKKEITDDIELFCSYFPILKTRFGQMALTLSGGEQQMLAIARGLMSKPKILLLDEPSLGLSPKLVKEIFGILNRLNKDQGVTILLVEQNAKAALDIADFGYVMELGRIVLDGKSSDLSEAKDIQEFYLGANQESQLGQKRWKNRKTWR